MPRTVRRGTKQTRLMVDASAFIALYDPADSNHRPAVEFRDSFILQYDVRLFTTNYVHAEVMSHLTHLPAPRLKLIDELFRRPTVTSPFRIQQIEVDRATLDKAMKSYFRYIEQDFSVTDCTCFAIMEERDIPAAFTFDNDYRIYSYQKGYQETHFWKLPEMLGAYMQAATPRQ